MQLEDQIASSSETSDSAGRWLDAVIERRYRRRDIIASGAALGVAQLIGSSALAKDDKQPGQHEAKGHHRKQRIDPGYDAVAAFNLGKEDEVVVPPGYSVQVILPEGTPIVARAPAYLPGDFNTGADREQQAGAHHDGMYFFPLARGREGNERGLLCLNHENIDAPLLHPTGVARGGDGSRPIEDQVRKEIASHGVSVVEIVQRRGGWRTHYGHFNRRITAATPMEISGPARGSPLLKTKFSPSGTRTRGTLNNCANGYTPWGTYLTCEENWAGYFYNAATANRPREHARYGVASNAMATPGWGTRSEDQYARFNATPSTASFHDGGGATDYRNEPNAFGWVVEIDPFNPKSTPKKRTALGRMAHEGAWAAPARIGKPIVIYMGDDSRGEYMYKFVSKRPYMPWHASGDRYLDEGTLYVARFEDDGTGSWLALEFGVNGLTPVNGFTSQADVLVNTRSAADFVQGTRMDRPEWAVVDERSGEVYLTLTNNSNRGSNASQPLNASNPRRSNPDGHIIRWREKSGDYGALEFNWDIFAMGGPTLATVQSLGAVAPYGGDSIYAAQVFPHSPQQQFLNDDATFNSPDGLWVDGVTGLVWIQTDGYSNAARGFGNQQMLAANPDTGVVKRFLVGPLGCEITGITATPDRRTLFVNIQHPDGTWPRIDGETRPRSATLVITKDDGGVIGS